ncbi:hypothetical protein PORCAN_1369 [Porphyromonas crevioricanis JCM 13913]|nr:hypothetical protein PORCAN_1369 [Porphyromonas crevioricanis JCM 13913]
MKMYSDRFAYSSLLKGSVLFLFLILALSCRISYKFDGASIDYNTTKTIYIADVINSAQHQYAPLASRLTESLRDLYIRRTKLEMVPYNGDLELECTIVSYDLAPMAIQENALSAETRFTMGVEVVFTNNVTPSQNFKRTFTEFTDFKSDILFNTIEDQLVEELSERILKQIYAATVENW